LRFGEADEVETEAEGFVADEVGMLDGGQKVDLQFTIYDGAKVGKIGHLTRIKLSLDQGHCKRRGMPIVLCKAKRPPCLTFKSIAMKKLIKFVLAAMFIKGVVDRIRKPHMA
jgi:hypothetical protein